MTVLTGLREGRRFGPAALAVCLIMLALVMLWSVGHQAALQTDSAATKETAGQAHRSATGDDRALDFPHTEPAASEIKTETLPPLNSRIIKTASVTVKVRREGFSRAYDRAALLAQAHGGYVAGSTSAAAVGDITSGSITIRIPADTFERVMAELKGLGKVRALNVRSQDVSQEFVDLESRLRHWRAQESILLTLMQKAQSIGDSIAVQNQLSTVQQQVEQITGRLNFLRNQTELSTIELTITETGVAVQPRDRWGFGTAVAQAAHAFVDTVNGMVIVLGYVLPIGLLAGLIYGMMSLWRRRPVDNASAA